MTLDQILLIAERIGIPALALGGILYFVIRYVWPFVINQAWPFLVGLIETGRKERVEERDKFLMAIDRLVNERDQERDAFIGSLNERDLKLVNARDIFLDHLQQRDQKFEPVVTALQGLVLSITELKKMTDERTTAISFSLALVQKQIDELIAKSHG